MLESNLPVVTNPLPADESSSPHDKTARIGPFRDAMEANLAKSRLLQEGIWAAVEGENLNTVLGPIYGLAYGGVFVIVRKDDLATARTIVKSAEAARQQRTYAESPPCPYCGAHASRRAFGRRNWPTIAVFAIAYVTIWLESTEVAVSLIVIGFLMLVWPRVPSWKCQNCRRLYQAPIPAVSEEPTDLPIL